MWECQFGPQRSLCPSIAVTDPLEALAPFSNSPASALVSLISKICSISPTTPFCGVGS